MLRKILIGLAVVAGLVLLLGLVLFLRYNEPLPEGQPSPEADSLARCMMDAVDAPAWDSLRFVAWNFMGQHDYVWDKERHLVEVRWGKQRVVLHTKTVTGKAWTDGREVEGRKADKLVQKAWSFFCNDSYWLNPVVKAFDPGTERRIVNLKDGREGLMVHYRSGGVTPGDSYVWILDEQCRPVAWKMWVQIIPIGGVENSWEGWQQLPGGAWIATKHSALGRTIEMIRNVRAGQSLEALGLKQDPFAGFEPPELSQLPQ